MEMQAYSVPPLHPPEHPRAGVYSVHASHDSPQHEAHNEHKSSPHKQKRHHKRQKSLGGKLAERVFGYSQPPPKEESNLPDGYTICHSRNGHPYLLRAADKVDQEAANEHKRADLPLSVSRQELGERFGVGVYLYFDFLLYLIFTNFLLLILGLVNFIIHAKTDPHPEKGREILETIFFISSYAAGSHRAWLITSIISIVLWFVFGPIYSLRVSRYFKQKQIDDFSDTFAAAEDYIKENEHVSRSQRTSRIVASYIIFVIVLAISSVIAFFLVVLSVTTSKENTYATSLFVAILVAVFIKFTNMIWQKICVFLTRMERHLTWTTFRKHNTLKFFLFKMLNVLIMYASRVLVPRLCPHIPKVSFYCQANSEVVTAACEFSSVGQQFFFILLLDLTVQNFWEVVSAWGKAKCNAKAGMMGEGSNDSVRPEFDVAEEYLELLYRQFIVYLAFAIFPLVALLGILCNFVEYKVDKYRLLRICKHPRGLQGSMKNFLTFFLFTTAVVALVSPPFGAAWVLSGQSSSMCTVL